VRQLNQQGIPRRPAQAAQQSNLHGGRPVEDLFGCRNSRGEEGIAERRPRIAEIEREGDRAAVVDLEVLGCEPQRIADRPTVELLSDVKR
jgi:hypothetical protein